MNLTFLNPLFLLGLAAGTLPILIHRLTQRKAVSRKFSAVRLLLQSQRITARPQRLKHLLLLALRILAVMTLVFMMARPVLIQQGFAALRSAGAKIVILDNSLSMGFSEERGVRYDLAKRAVREALNGFQGQVAVIPTMDVRDRQNREFKWMESEEASKGLATLPLSYGKGDTNAALSLAYYQLRDLKLSKQILIVSDLAHGDWEGLDLSKLGTLSDADILFLRIGSPDRDPNLCIKSVSLVEGEALVGVPSRLEAAISNFSNTAKDALIQLYLSGTKVDQKSIDLKAGEDGKAYFELYLQRPGWIDGEVRLSEDHLDSDNVFYFPLKVREKIKVLVLDGDPRTSLKASESYYVVNALVPGGLEGSPFSVRVITEGEMEKVDLRLYDAIFLLNVGRPPPSRLTSFLDAGKPVFIFLGDRVSPEEYNALSFFPWRIGPVRDVGQKPEEIVQVDRESEPLRFLSSKEVNLKGANFRRYFRIEGSIKNLLTLGNHDPLLVEANVGKSRLFMFASSADQDWNDLPLKAAYLPLIQGLLKEAVGLAGSSLLAGLRVGEPFKEQAHPTQIKGTQEGPGIYQFLLPSGEVRRGVNVPYEESNLTKLTKGELEKKFGAIHIQVVEYKEGILKDLQSGRKELWPILLVFLMAVLVVEMVIANRI